MEEDSGSRTFTDGYCNIFLQYIRLIVVGVKHSVRYHAVSEAGEVIRRNTVVVNA